MFRTSLGLALVVTLGTSTAWAGWFSKGVGKYGPYTGGHGYSYATAYHYGFAWSAADTWNRDIFAYPGGISPYRPYGKPISKTVFPHPDTPYIAIPGANGLPTLVKPHVANPDDAPMPIVVPNGTLLPLGPVGASSDLPLTPPATLVPTPIPAATTPTTLSATPTPVSATPADAGRIRVRVPADAEVWIDKQKMTLTGTERIYQTPTLTPGQMQVYSVRAKWTEGGREVEQYRVVGVKPGETARLTFTNTQP